MNKCEKEEDENEQSLEEEWRNRDYRQRWRDIQGD